jgi:hypothetical protein
MQGDPSRTGIKKLGTTAMNAYRMRIFEDRALPASSL